jgi:hypothetical protein
MPRPRRLALFGLLLAGASAVGPACLSATQFDVRLTTDLDCARLDAVEIFVGPKGAVDRTAPQAVVEVSSCKGADLGNVVVVPSGRRDAPSASTCCSA